MFRTTPGFDAGRPVGLDCRVMSGRPVRKQDQRPRAIVYAVALIIAWISVWTACASGGSYGFNPRPVELSLCGRAFVFVDHGRPAATIVIPEGAGETERRAAEILRTSILKMSGVDLPVREAAEPGRPGVAAIGFPVKDLPPAVASSLPSLRPDGFLVATSTGNLYIAGGGGEGRHLRRRPSSRKILRLPPLQPDRRSLPASRRPRRRLPLRGRQSGERGPHRQRRLRPRSRLPRLDEAPRRRPTSTARAITSTPSRSSFPGRPISTPTPSTSP